MTSNNDFEKLIENLPFFLQETLKKHNSHDQLIEIILDLGRRPEARFSFGPEYLSQKIISWQDLDYVTKRLSKFSNENRAGIERTLHRISCIRNRQFLINGLTCRIGRSIFGTVSVIRDLLESEKSILILGKPGVGKTTIIREIGRVLADELEKRVIIIDTSNEIAGDSDIPHFGIGRARRMQVPKTELQHQVMIEAVENHMPQVIIIDEIGTELEVLAARTIAEKGVQLVGTTHGNCLENLIKNPPLSNLIGGIQYVTLSDEEAKRRGTQKSILERKAYPAFEIIIEINDPSLWTIHEDVALSADYFLRGDSLPSQTRHFSRIEKIQIQCNKPLISYNSFVKVSKNTNELPPPLIQSWVQLNNQKTDQGIKQMTKTLLIYPYCISTNIIKEVFSKIGVNCMVTNNLQKASLIIGLDHHLYQNTKLKQFVLTEKIPVYSLTQINIYELTNLIKLVTN
ncbi:Ycf45 related protein (plastid) [Nitzschia inconspicua]|uniref:Ycf45 related protein n=1 Tax=Nitzschia inconspicua TaxID=303405 RepID=A0A8H2SIG3_9STRA|nr:Ycf45 related protein [Nitzschia inconspicua]